MKRKRQYVSLLLLLALLLTACGSREEEKVVSVYNWGQYIDPALLDRFEEETGIRVIYSVYTTNEDLYVKLQNGGTNYDLICPSSYMLDKLIHEGALQEIDQTKIPNVRYLDETYLHKGADREQRFSLPYFWGTVGILYNKKMVDEPVDSWDIMWDPRYYRNVIMMDSVRDTLGAALARRGFSENSKEERELEQVKEDLAGQYPMVYAYLVDQIRDLMINNECALAMAFSGDATAAIKKNPDLDFVVPKEGSNLWIDSFAIPKTAEHKENAEAFINFMLEPHNMAQNGEYIGYSIPSSEAQSLLPEKDRSIKAAYPDPEVFDRLEVFTDLGPCLDVYNEIWQEVKNQ